MLPVLLRPAMLAPAPQLLAPASHAPLACPALPSNTENDFIAVRPLCPPTVADRLLLVDGVRLLGLRPLQPAPCLMGAVYTVGG